MLRVCEMHHEGLATGVESRAFGGHSFRVLPPQRFVGDPEVRKKTTCSFLSRSLRVLGEARAGKRGREPEDVVRENWRRRGQSGRNAAHAAEQVRGMARPLERQDRFTYRRGESSFGPHVADRHQWTITQIERRPLAPRNQSRLMFRSARAPIPKS